MFGYAIYFCGFRRGSSVNAGVFCWCTEVIRCILQNMAGLQHCCRKLLIYNTSRLVTRNGTLLQPVRSRHHLVFQISQRNGIFSQRTKLLFDSYGQQLLFRLASTNVNPQKETVSNTSKTETTTEAVASNSSEAGVVQSSNSNIIIDESALPPAPLARVDEVPPMEFVSAGLKEPSFESLGLGSWWPPGLVQQVFEYLHIHLDLPWWQAIVVVTLISRTLLFPINLRVRKDTIHMTNHAPEMGILQQRISDARRVGDHYAVATYTQDLQKFIIEKNINPLAFLKTAFIQGPVFISMFYALKGMANAPVESMKTGGLFWFKDLTQPDPYYILPVILSSTLLCVLELGAEGPAVNQTSAKVRWIMRAIPVITLAISLKFSSCITFYWTVSNLILLTQVGLMKIPAVARVLKLPRPIKHDMSKMATKKEGFFKSMKDGFINAQIVNEIENRERANLMQFQKAGSGAIPRTFKRNPLQAKENK